MKKLLIVQLLIFSNLFLTAQDSLNFTKLSTWTSSSANDYNDIWGYTDTSGNEYAILGSNWGTHFINITDPQNPIEVNSFIGKAFSTNVIWRDFKTYGNYAYGVCDGYGVSSLQIFDLSNLPTSVTKVYDNDSLTINAHNIFIESDRVYLPSNRRGPSLNALDILSISNPTNPTLLSTMDAFTYFGNCSGCLHDIYVKNDTAYCSAGNSGLFIYDLTDPLNPNLIAHIDGYTDDGYNHASWANEDKNVLIMADETHGSAVKSFDISDISNPIEIDAFETYPDAIPHNPFVRGTEAYISYYHDGMQVFDISDPTNVTQKAFYDTYPSNSPTNHTGYEGDWGVYPFFDSKNIIASDISTGLYVLGKTNDVYTIDDDFSLCYPDTTISIPYEIKGTFNTGNIFYLELSDSNGTFKSPTIISSINSTTNGAFNTNLPSNIVRGHEYKVRVRSTNPAVIEGEYQRITLYKENKIDINTSICFGDSLVIGDSVFISDGSFTGTISGGSNCDTNFAVTLQISSSFFNLNDTICNGETYVFGSVIFDSTGIYSDTIISINGCDTLFTLDLFVDDLIQPIIVNNNGILEVDSASTYQWFFNGQTILNATSQTFTPPANGNYTVKISNGNCTLESEIYTYSDGNNTDILSKQKNELFNIYPNPSNGIINIKNNKNVDFDIEIINSLGQIIETRIKVKAVKLKLSKGLYTVQIISKKGVYSEKIIVD